MSDINKEWIEAEKALAKKRKEKKEALALAMGVAAILHVDALNKAPEITEEQAAEKWQSLSGTKRAKYLYYHEVFTDL